MTFRKKALLLSLVCWAGCAGNTTTDQGPGDGLEQGSRDAQVDRTSAEMGITDGALPEGSAGPDLLSSRFDVAVGAPPAGFCCAARLWYLSQLATLGIEGSTVCEVLGGSRCDAVSSLGEGVCRGAGGSFCGSVSTLGEGICRANEGRFCSGVGLGEGICRAGAESATVCTELGVEEALCRLGAGARCSGVTDLGEGICRGCGGSLCSGVSSLGAGLCRAAGGAFCSQVETVAEGLCRAGDGTLCTGLTNQGEAICRALGQTNCAGSRINWLVVLVARCGVIL